MPWYDICGWGGSALVLFAYYMVNRNQWEPEHANSKIANLVGCSLMALNALMHRAWPLFAFEAAWFLVTLGTWWWVKRQNPM